MAVVQNPLFSIAASGKFGSSIVFYRWKGVDVARKYVKSTIAPTALQTTVRSYFQMAVASWKQQNQTVKDGWNQYCADNDLKQSGYNLYVGAYVEYMKGHAGTEPTSITTPPNMA